MASQVAWIGLGNMGRGMAKNLVEKGNLSRPLIIFNRTRKRADDLSSQLTPNTTTVVTSISEAVEPADIIFTCVGDDAAIVETIEAALAGGNVKGKLFVDCSTVHPETTSKIAEMLQGKGAEFVACPVFGAPPMADAGQLVTVLAGPSDSVRKVKPYTTGVMGRADIDFSDEPASKATQLKIIGNTFIINMVEILAEGHTLAEKTGLGNDNLHKFIEAMFPGPFVAYSARLLKGDYYKREEPLFAADLARKDARHAMNLASGAGVSMKALEVADGHLGDVQSYAGKRGDLAGIYGVVRQESGLPYEN